MMGSQVYCRLLGYSLTLLMHISNLVYMRTTILASKETKGSLDDAGIKIFRSMEFRYFTTWTVGLQIGYAICGLFSDTLVLMNKGDKQYKLPKLLRDFREIMFCGLVWPCSWVVFIIFWTVFKYDRSLIFPEFLDKIITPLSNHILHSAITPVVIWEVIFRPRKQPRSHVRYIMQLLLHMLTYACVLYFTYFEHKIWLYPIFGAAYGTIYFFLIHVYIGVLCILSYYAQWWLNDIVHGSQEKIENKLE